MALSAQFRGPYLATSTAQPGAVIKAGEPLLIIESMKMEVQVRSPASGIVQSLAATKGQVVRAGQRLGVVAP